MLITVTVRVSYDRRGDHDGNTLLHKDLDMSQHVLKYVEYNYMCVSVPDDKHSRPNTPLIQENKTD